MIIAVSMNPSIDKILHISRLVKGSTNRVVSSSETAGGKGINVANVLSAFTNDLALVGFCGNSNSEIMDSCEKSLKEKGVIVDLVRINGKNRTNMKIIESGGALTEINESGFLVTPNKLYEFKEKLYKYANAGNTYILTGSIPEGVDKHIYGELTKELKDKGCKVFVDASGDALRYATEACPNVIKPNQEEILELFNEKSVSEKTLINMGRELCLKGIDTVIISRGSLGSIFVTKNETLRCEVIPVDVSSSVGAGDAMIACFAYALAAGLSYEDCIRLSVAAASYTVTIDESALSNRSEVDSLLDKVNMKLIH